jgi:putative aldouronate transport system permease protein
MSRVRSKLFSSDGLYLALVFGFLGLFTFSVVYPLIYVVSASFSSPYALIAGRVFLWPVDFSLRGYEAVFKSNQVLIGYANSILYTVVGVFFNLTAMFLAAYPLSRREFPARKVITFVFAFTMFFNGGLIPSYLLVKNLDMLDKIWALVVPGAVSVYAIIICRTFIRSSIPEELFEASSMDGCDYFRYLWRIILPLSKPVIAVMALSFATGHWNSYFTAMIYLKSPEMYPLQMVLRNILVQNVVDMTSLKSLNVKDELERQYIGELLKYSLIVVSSVPLLLFYPFVQKYFIKGVMVGSIKG